MNLFDLFEDRRREYKRKKKLDTASRVALGFILSAVTEILSAPKSGEETRAEISKKSKGLAQRGSEVARDTAEAVQFRTYETDEAIENIYGDLKLRAALKKKGPEDDVEITKTKADTIGEIVRDSRAEIKGELKDAGEEVKDAAKKVGKGAKKSAKEIKDEAEKSAKNIGKEVRKSSKKIKKETKN